MLRRLRLVTAGESHGPTLTAVLEGIPAGLELNPAELDEQLARRQLGYGAGGRMKIERDRVRITGGWLAGKTTGAPLCLAIDNLDHEAWKDRDIDPMTRPRPGHVDLVAAVKYGYRDLRAGLERASARETAARVAAGAVCRALLGKLGVTVGGYVTRLGPVTVALKPEPDREEYMRRFAAAESNDVRCPDEASLELMRDAIKECRRDRDTLGGVVEVVALGLPVGLGSFTQWDLRLDARLAMAVMSIQAVKGVEIGPAFDNASLRGSQVHDEIVLGDQGGLLRRTNRAGGLEGGVSSGEPLVIRAAMKPISTTMAPRQTVDLATGKPEGTRYERSDICAVPRLVPIAEAMVAVVLADALMEKLGGDSMQELVPRLHQLRKPLLDQLPMDNVPWRFEPGDGR